MSCATHHLCTLQGTRLLQELILFSRADLERSIPNMVDGLKVGQRKILFACFKRNLRKEIKVGPASIASQAGWSKFLWERAHD